MLKVMTIVGTRPEIIRLSRTISKFDEFFEHTLIHTGQSYDFGLSQVFFDELGIREPDEHLRAAGSSAAETIGQTIVAVDGALARHRPDAVLILGDTNSALGAIAAKRRKVPIFHMEAGNRCYDARVPEEINRRIVDHTADINLTYSDIARWNLLREGLPSDQTIKVGSPMREVLLYNAPRIRQSPVLERLGLTPGHYLLVSAHREENVDAPEKLAQLVVILDELASRYGEPVVVSTHPRTRKRLDDLAAGHSEAVRFLEPFGFLDYIRLQQEARAVLSDSGTITEESSILNFPALNLREAHERLEGMEEGVVPMVGFHLDRIVDGLRILESQSRGDARSLRIVRDYEADNVSDKVARIVLSYTDYVNRRVWYKRSE
jgi:UDP-N-acetylglucosamine 2-epimerase